MQGLPIRKGHYAIVLGVLVDFRCRLTAVATKQHECRQRLNQAWCTCKKTAHNRNSAGCWNKYRVDLRLAFRQKQEPVTVPVVIESLLTTGAENRAEATTTATTAALRATTTHPGVQFMFFHIKPVCFTGHCVSATAGNFSIAEFAEFIVSL